MLNSPAEGPDLSSTKAPTIDDLSLLNAKLIILVYVILAIVPISALRWVVCRSFCIGFAK